MPPEANNGPDENKGAPQDSTAAPGMPRAKKDSKSSSSNGDTVKPDSNSAADPIETTVKLADAVENTVKMVVSDSSDQAAKSALDPVATPSSSDEPVPGTVFAEHFQIKALLGKGGMSKVYSAEDTRLEKIVAIKTLLPHLLEREDSVQRFTREARSIGDLDHGNIVRVYQLGITKSGVPFIVMDYLEGVPLNDLIDQLSKLSYERAVPIFIQIAEAFEHAHGKGVVHRDLKPGNVILRKKGEKNDSVCIVDFGLAKFMPHANKDTASLSATGDIFGSPPYMSPEQCRGSKVDARSDIYSFGCLMYEVLTGRPPLTGETPIATVMKQVTEVPPALNKFANVPPTLEALILQTLEKEPEKRQQSMSEVLSELRNFVTLQQAGLEFKPTDLSVQFHQRLTRNKKPWMIGFGIVGLIAIIALGCWYMWLTQYSFDFTPRLISSIIIFVIVGSAIGFPLYKFFELSQKMQARELDEVVPRLEWRDIGEPPEQPAEQIKADAVTTVESIEQGTTSGGGNELAGVKEKLSALVSIGQLDEAEYRSTHAIEVLKKRGEDKTALGYLLKEILADASLAQGAFAKAEGLYRETAYHCEVKDRPETSLRAVELKLADSLFMQSRYADAQVLYSCCLFATNRLGEGRDKVYALRLSRLGDCYFHIGSYKLAEEQYSSAIALWKELGENANKNLAYIKYAYTMAKRFTPMKADKSFALAVREIKEDFGTTSKQHIAALKLYANHLWRDGDRLKAHAQRKDADALESQ